MKQKPAVEPINETKACCRAYKMKQKPAVEPINETKARG